MAQGKTADGTGAKIEYFTVLKCSKLMNFGAITRALKKAGKKASKPYQDCSKKIFEKKGVSNYIRKDIPRFLSEYVLSNRGKVVKDRFDKTTGREFLLKLKEALGADVEIPEESLFETANREKLGKLCKENYTDGTEWETVLRMLCQQHGVLGIQEFQKAATEAGLSDRPRPYSRDGSLAYRFKPEEMWHFLIEVTDKEVKVSQFTVLCEAPGFPVEFKVRLTMENVLDRKSGKLKAEIAGIETTQGDFKD